MPLTDTAIRNAKPLQKSYKLSDSQGLYLLVSPSGSKLWYLKYRYDSKEKKLAFGPYPAVSLAMARELRTKARADLSHAVDPGLKRQREKQARKNGNTFEEVARAWHSRNRRWSEVHAGRILRSLELHVFPRIGQIPITDITAGDLLVPLRITEKKGNLEVAMRLQQRMTGIMRYAVQEYLITHNPATDLVGAIMPPEKKHYPALPLERLPELLERIHRYPGRALTRLAVLFNLLVFVRSSELRFARWEEIDFGETLWTLPAQRVSLEGVRYSSRGAKMKATHLVPLSLQAIRVLREIRALSGELPLLFPGDHSPDKPMSENTINKALRTMGYGTTEICGHGFRTMACSALVESGRWSRDAVERQMSHQERNSVRAAYIHKAEHLDERQQMMQWWADYLDANLDSFVSPWRFQNNGDATA